LGVRGLGVRGLGEGRGENRREEVWRIELGFLFTIYDL